MSDKTTGRIIHEFSVTTSPSKELLAEAVAYAKQQHAIREGEQRRPRRQNANSDHVREMPQRLPNVPTHKNTVAGAAFVPAATVSVIERTIEPLLKDLGFTKSGQRYSGNFKTDDVMVEGYIEQRINGECEPHVFLPLDVQSQLKKYSPKWACFHPDGEKGWFRLNLVTAPKEPSAAILEVLSILKEAYAEK